MAPSSQSWDAERYVRNASFVAEHGGEIAAWLDAKPGMRILDLGCGDGALTASLAATGAEVIGVDSSPEMVAAARRRGLDARLMDGADLAFDGGFDAVFSSAALHWMLDAGAVIAGVARALRPGGRFVGEMGGEGNVAAVVVALGAALTPRGVDAAALNPWHFPAPEAWTALLEGGGFAVERMALVPRPTTLPGPLADWLETFAGAFLDALDDDRRAACVEEVSEALAPRYRDARAVWRLDYVRLRFAARLKEK